MMFKTPTIHLLIKMNKVREKKTLSPKQHFVLFLVYQLLQYNYRFRQECVIIPKLKWRNQDGYP